MAERKVLNKYFPPDFDPTNLAKKTPWKEQKVVVRMMLPMNVQCKLCKEYMYRGTKFNTRKEDVEGETYLGIRKYRFYFKCLGCSQPFCLKTDPENADYECESGVTRNFEPWRAREADEKAWKEKREAEEQGDAMKALENRTKESARELDFLDALAEMREKNKKLAAAEADPDQVLAKVAERHIKKAKELTKDEEAQMKKAFEEAARRRRKEADERMLADRRAEAASNSFASSNSSAPSASFAPSVSSADAKRAEDILLARSSRPSNSTNLSTPLFTITIAPEKSKSKKKKKKKSKEKKRKKRDKDKESPGANDSAATASHKKQKVVNGTSAPSNGVEAKRKDIPNPLAALGAYDSSDSE